MSVTILPGDCIATMQTLPAGTFQTCVTSPPYYGLRDYGVAGQIGLEDTPDAYIARMVEVFREVRRVLRDDGTAWVNIGDSYNNFRAQMGPGQALHGRDDLRSKPEPDSRKRGWHGAKEKDLLGIPWMLAFALRADGWFLRSAIVWAKPNPMPESVRDRPTSAYEMVFLLSKRAAYYYDADAVREEYAPASAERYAYEFRADVPSAKANKSPALGAGKIEQNPNGRNARNVWTIATQPYSGAHFATMPPDLAERCIKAGTSEKGQCPHCGAPWRRVVERTKATSRYTTSDYGDGAGRNDGGRSELRGASAQTVGWQRSCVLCFQEEAPPVPQHVLDPFGGAGTTGLVADRLGRHATLCELNAAYAALARERITADAPLLAAIA